MRRLRPAAVFIVSIAFIVFVATAAWRIEHRAHDICDVHPDEPPSKDYRHNAKHVPLPSTPPVETTVSEILHWPEGPNPVSDAPRKDRELSWFHIQRAYLQHSHVNMQDGDLHFELSDVPDRNAPRIIVETPVDPEYCPARKQIRYELRKHGFRYAAQLRHIPGAGWLCSMALKFSTGTWAKSHGPAVWPLCGELRAAIPVEVSGLAFRDFEHNRGTPHVETAWELHPAIIHSIEAANARAGAEATIRAGAACLHCPR